MKKIYLLFVLLLLIASVSGQKAKVITDTDTGNEIDDARDRPCIEMGKIDLQALTAARTLTYLIAATG